MVPGVTRSLQNPQHLAPCMPLLRPGPHGCSPEAGKAAAQLGPTPALLGTLSSTHALSVTGAHSSSQCGEGHGARWLPPWRQLLAGNEGKGGSLHQDPGRRSTHRPARLSRMPPVRAEPPTLFSFEPLQQHASPRAVTCIWERPVVLDGQTVQHKESSPNYFPN